MGLEDSFVNTGTLYLSDISNFNVSGVVNTEKIVCGNGVPDRLIDALKEKSSGDGTVVKEGESTLSTSTRYTITYDGNPPRGSRAVLLDANLTESIGRLVSDGPFAERIEGVLLVPVMVFKVHFLTSLRAGRQVVVSPFTPYWFSKCPFWPFFRKLLKNTFFAAHAALLSFCSGGCSFQNEGRRGAAAHGEKVP